MVGTPILSESSTCKGLKETMSQIASPSVAEQIPEIGAKKNLIDMVVA